MPHIVRVCFWRLNESIRPLPAAPKACQFTTFIGYRLLLLSIARYRGAFSSSKKGILYVAKQTDGADHGQRARGHHGRGRRNAAISAHQGTLQAGGSARREVSARRH